MISIGKFHRDNYLANLENYMKLQSSILDNMKEKEIRCENKSVGLDLIFTRFMLMYDLL